LLQESSQKIYQLENNISDLKYHLESSRHLRGADETMMNDALSHAYEIAERGRDKPKDSHPSTSSTYGNTKANDLYAVLDRMKSGLENLKVNADKNQKMVEDLKNRKN
jgi:hypothetical protein